MPGNRCSNCIAYSFECAYVEAAKVYVESIESRVEKIEALLQTVSTLFCSLLPPPNSHPFQFLPEADLERELAETSPPRWRPPPVDDQDERDQLSLHENLQRLSVSSDRDSRFFGRSSGAMLLQTALNIKLDAEPRSARRHTEFWASRPSPEPVPPPQYTFPPPDLAASLVDLYFTHVNLILPLLHRPTFARDLAVGLHLTNDGFAATFLMVCAIGARFSSDSRVLLDGTDNLHSCGWRWFEQLQLMRDPLGPPPCLYDLQFSALSVLFLHGTSAPQAGWTLVSIGIRMAQDVGAHRRKDHQHRWTAEDEAWKRAFWVLVFLDRVLSAHFGRPCAIQDEDFDLDFPIDCDDEYWETPDPAQAFHQPRGKPSRVAAFIAYLRLCQVLSFTLRTVYSIDKSKVLLGLSKNDNNDWDHRVIVELDSALNKWIDEMPDHLRWNPLNEHAEFFEQSVMLHCSYYHLQIIIHRPYIPNPKKSVPPAFPSLAICLHAARSLSHVADIHRQRTGSKPMPLSQAFFSAGLVLLLNIWGGKRSGLGLSTDSEQEMAEVHRCMQVLRGWEMRWQSAGKLWDILYELASVGQLPLPVSANTKNKRERGAEEPKSATAAHPPSAPGLPKRRGGNSHARVHARSDTPLSSSSIQSHQQQIPYVPSVNSAIHERIDLCRPSQEYWYSEQEQATSISSSHDSMHQPSSTSGSGNNSNVRPHAGATSPSFPVSEAFYESLAASFASPSNLRHSNSSTVNYAEHIPREYPDGSVQNRVSSGASVHNNHRLCPSLADLARGVGIVPPPPPAEMDQDAMTMWSAAPVGFELDDWGSYLSTVNEITQARTNAGG
ncbi:fungal-specific transcription factor domain-containing protein [Mycena maculata]|uniref:Fungal-specific transcription factor domain-containing protein n=1 Tax=Mycena maculata TaxID=230809 RepID=A0AAD7JIC2_9AGAR|nr:fungal-specific transcription factor domain-containing protein [Mycena maculata]